MGLGPLVACLYLAICGYAGGYVATQKRREVIEGILFGLFLGPFGVIAAACMPDEPEPSAANEPRTLLTAMEQKRLAEVLAKKNRSVSSGEPGPGIDDRA